VQYEGTKSALSRRAFVGKLAAGAAVACVAGAEKARAITARRQPAAASVEREVAQQPQPVDAPAAEVVSTAPWDLVQPLALGSTVAEGWHVAGLSGADAGSCVLTLQNARGRPHRIHLCRNDGQPQGMVYTRRFDLLVMNGGAGEMPTEEGLAQAVAAVAHVVAANEAAEHSEQLASALLPQAERIARYSAGRQLR
jgi:hypothetical protein